MCGVLRTDEEGRRWSGEVSFKSPQQAEWEREAYHDVCVSYLMTLVQRKPSQAERETAKSTGRRESCSSSCSAAFQLPLLQLLLLVKLTRTNTRLLGPVVKSEPPHRVEMEQNTSLNLGEFDPLTSPSRGLGGLSELEGLEVRSYIICPGARARSGCCR